MDTFVALFSFLYMFWPLILLFSLRHIFNTEHPLIDRIRITIRNAFVTWIILGAFLGFIYWQDRKPILIMPEKIDHVLFFTIGGILACITITWLVIRWRRRWINLKNNQKLEDLLELSPNEFEELIAALFRFYGHQAQLSGGNADHGVDVIVQSAQGEKWIVQCKRYKGSVGEPIVRDLFGTMAHEEAQKAYLITTGSYTAQALAWAEGKPLVLYDGEKLVKLIKRVQRRKPRLLR